MTVSSFLTMVRLWISSVMNQKIGTVVFILILISLICVTIVWFKPSQQKTQPMTTAALVPAQNTSPPSQENQPSDGIILPQADQSEKTGLENLPQSLQGTQVDGDIIINEQHQLVVTFGLKRLFDYFLSALGEEDEPQIISRIEAYILSHTPNPAAQQAIDILHNYIHYLKALKELQNHYGMLQMQDTKNGKLDLSLIKSQQNKIHELRKQFFNQETITAFFSQEDDLLNYNLAMFSIEDNSQLSDTQKSKAKQEYISRLPNDSATKQYLQEQQTLSTLLNATEELKLKGASKEELFEMRKSLVGEQAAERLAKIDEEDEAFEHRFAQYEKAKHQILQQYGDTQEGEQHLQVIAKTLFNDKEIKRLQGYEKWRQVQSSPQ